MHGRVLVNGHDRGGGCVVTRQVALTAGHVIRESADAVLEFRLPTGHRIPVIDTESDKELDIAVLHLAEAVAVTPVTTAVVGDPWRVAGAALDNDPELDGTVTSTTHTITNARGHPVQVVQLLVHQEMRNYEGYSGSAVVLPSSSGVAAILVEQVESRLRAQAGRRREASNVLYAVPVHAALRRFRLSGTVPARERLPSRTPIANLMASTLGGPADPMPFGGRAVELAQLDSWLHGEPPDGRLLITAAAGRGKSSLLIHWVDALSHASQQTDELSIVFVPINIAFEIATQDVVYRALVSRVAKAYHSPVVVSGRGADELREELADLLHRPPPSGRLLVVIDGLDEAVGWDPGPHFFPHRLADGIRVVMAARHTADRPTAQDWRDRIGWPRARVLELPKLTLDGVEDVLARQPGLYDALPDPKMLASELHRLSDGEPVVLSLYVTEMAELLQKEGRVPDPASLRSVGRGLTAYFERWWADQQVQWRSGVGPVSADVSALLDTLALAYGPMSRADAANVLRRLSPVSEQQLPIGDRLDGALLALRRFLARGEGDRSLALAHPRYAAERQNRLLEDGDFARVEGAYLSWAQNTFRDLRKGRSAAKDISPYLVKHLGRHIDRAGTVPPGLLTSLGSTEWRLAWDETAEDVHGHLPDVRRAGRGLTVPAQRTIGRNRPPFPVGAAIGVAVSAADTGAQAICLSAPLVTELARWGVWSEGRAIGYVRNWQDHEERAEAVGLLIPVLRGTERGEIDALLDSVRPAAGLEFAEALAAYTSYLARTSSPAEAVSVAEHQVVPDLPYQSAGSRRTYEEACALIALLPRLDDGLALRAVRGLLERLRGVPGVRGTLLRRLTDTVPADQALRLTTGLGYRDPGHAVFAWLQGDSAPGIRDSTDAWFPSTVSVACPWLPEPVRGERLSDAVDQLVEFPDRMWAEFIGNMVGYLTPGLSRRLMAMAASLDTKSRCTVYAVLSRSALGSVERRQIKNFLLTDGDEALAEGGSDTTRALTDMSRGGFGALALDVISRAEPHSGLWGALTAVAPTLREELIPDALRVASAEVHAGSHNGLRAVLARWAGFGPDQARQAVAATYRTQLPKNEDRVLALSLAARPPSPRWDGALAEVDDGELRFAALTAMYHRFPLVGADVALDAAELVPSWLRNPARHIAQRALADRAGPGVVSRLIARHPYLDGWSTPDTPRAFHSYFSALRDTATTQDLVTCAERSGHPFAMACALSVAGPDLAPDQVSAVLVAAGQVARKGRPVRRAGNEASWLAANLVTALLPQVPAARAEELWEEIETWLRLETAEMPHYQTWAAQLFHHVPDRFRDRAWNLLLLPEFAHGKSVFPIGARTDDVPVGWATDVEALIDAFDREHLDILSETTERKVGSSGERQRLRGAIAMRSARLGDLPGAMRALEQCASDEICAAAAKTIALELPADHLGKWVPFVLNRFWRPAASSLRAAVLASTSHAQTSVPLPLATDVIGHWLAEGQWRHRRDLAAEMVGLATMLLRLGTNGDTILSAVRGDTSLRTLRGLLP